MFPRMSRSAGSGVLRAPMAIAALVFMSTALPAAIFAQGTGIITGQVLDNQTRAALGSVQVFMAGTQVGTLTDQAGRYRLVSVPAGTRNVRAVLIGYREVTQAVAVASGATVVANFALRESALELDALVVTGTPG